MEVCVTHLGWMGFRIDHWTHIFQIQLRDLRAHLMKKEIFDSLAKLSPESGVSNSIPQMTPSLEISGELAFCLNTLMNTVGQKTVHLSDGIVNSGLSSSRNFRFIVPLHTKGKYVFFRLIDQKA